jgi:nitronate monooxygenase
MRQLHPGTAVNDFLARFGLAHRVVQGPMAGGASTIDLALAVCNAGALGSLAAALLPPQSILDAAATLRRGTDKPFNLNLMVLDEPRPEDPKIAAQIARAVELLKPIRRELGLSEVSVPAKFCERFVDQLAAVREAAPAFASFTFGIISANEVKALHAAGCAVIGTATNVAEARAWEEAGADIICASGFEAGGHRGTFIGRQEDSLIGVFALLPQVVDAVKIPVIAAGGIMEGRAIAAVCQLGAVAAQLGTAFLTCPESGAHPEWKRLLASPAATRTVLTRAFSGRLARGLVNEYIERMQPHAHELPAYPIMNALTGELRAAAGKANRTGFLSLWAGQGAAMSRGLPAAALVKLLAEELEQARQ